MSSITSAPATGFTNVSDAGNHVVSGNLTVQGRSYLSAPIMGRGAFPIVTQISLNDALETDTTHNTLNSRMPCVVPTTSDVTDIVLAYPGWYDPNPEAVFPQGYTVTCAIEYPAGTFYPAYFSGVRTGTVTPGFANLQTDPVVISIPAGATFWVKTFCAWSVGTFPMSSGQAVLWLNGINVSGSWTTFGTDASDATLVAGNQVPTSLASGFGPAVLGRLKTPTIVLGMMGDSISRALENPDPILYYSGTFIGRAMRNQFPVIRLDKAAETMANYVSHPQGRNSLLRDAITHIILAHGRNDIEVVTPATLEATLQQAADPFLARGVAVYAVTLLPTTTSTDGWATIANQTIASTSVNTNRVQYNDWLRGNWASIGLSGIFDWADAVETSRNSGIWKADNLSAGYGAMGITTISAGSVVTCAQQFAGVLTVLNGVGYPNGTVVPCTVFNQPGDNTGQGAVITANINGSGYASTFNVVNSGLNYTLPPWVMVKGAWTSDGIHPRGGTYSAIISLTGMGPGAFT